MIRHGFLQDNNGNWSDGRAMQWLALLVGLGIAIMMILKSSVSFGDGMPLVITLLGYSLGGKLFQKAIERNAK